MRLPFGLEIGWASREEKAAGLQSVDSRLSGWTRIMEPYTGAWQRNVSIDRDTVITHSTVYACVSLIVNSIAKLRTRLVEEVHPDIWVEVQNAAFSPVLRKPNKNQTYIQFNSQWITSKLLHGNTYVLKVRDRRNTVVELYVLDPTRVKVLQAPDGEVFYELKSDYFAGQESETLMVPAYDIIHDRMPTLFHPLCGISPITAAGLSATQSNWIQNQSSKFFSNGARPGGILTAPGKVDPEEAQRMKTYWEEGFTGDNAGKVAVLGMGLKYEQILMSASDAQTIEQLKWTAENICSCFLVPPFMVGIGAIPGLNNVEAITQNFYSNCLQILIENYEVCMDEGLGLNIKKGDKRLGVELNLKDLIRMDTASKVTAITNMIKGSIATINEGRSHFDLPPVKGGDTIFMQQQNYSLEALANRDEDALLAPPKPQAALPPPEEEDPEDEEDEEEGEAEKPPKDEEDKDLDYEQLSKEYSTLLDAREARNEA